MATVNKVTKLYPATDEACIQAHMDIQNADGWYLVAIDTNLRGWYRFFWAKENP